MVCSIIKSIQSMLKEDLNKHSIQPKSVNIIFPVANDAVVQTSYAILLYKIIVRNGPTPILPGAHADGCSIHGMFVVGEQGRSLGSCATCPFMKMNSIDSLTNVMKMIVQHDTAALEPYKPKVCFTCGCDPV